MSQIEEPLRRGLTLKAVGLNPLNIAARNDLALTYAMLGMVDQARAEFTAVLEVDPANEVVRKNIVYL